MGFLIHNWMDQTNFDEEIIPPQDLITLDSEKDLISFDDAPLHRPEIEIGVIIEVEKGLSPSEPKSDRLVPKYAFKIDMSTFPIELKPRKYYEYELSRVTAKDYVNMPLLRPIFIDGRGVSNAYKNSRLDSDFDLLSRQIEYDYEVIPMVRCLYYWISHGHKTKLCLPKISSISGEPSINRNFHEPTISHPDILKSLYKANLLVFMGSNDRLQWFIEYTGAHNGILITDISDYRFTDGEDPSSPAELTNPISPHPKYMFHPFFNKEYAYFPPGRGSVNISDWKEVSLNVERPMFEKLYNEQLLFKDQLRQMKLLLNYMPEERNFFEEKAYEKLLETIMPILDKFEFACELTQSNSLI